MHWKERQKRPNFDPKRGELCLPVRWEDFKEDEHPGYHLTPEGYLVCVFREQRPRELRSGS
ncbi:MAG: hypothetical protein OXF23_06100 [Candidatus Dadabacteria bacterium]|nr:hypothetical protein [Candidatus Dadabacteria bacterium]